MSFGLLTPLFLAGLAAIAIPILVHLVRREEQLSFAFPSLMFLKRIPVREHRRRTIRHWWLLALRCLIVALLALAFAKPFIEWSMDRTASVTGARDRVILLDRSHSMQAGSRWNDARRSARAAIDELGPGDRAALVLFDHDTLITQKLTPNHTSLRTALAGAGTGDGHTDLAAAIARAGALLENSSAETRDIVLVSDLQRSAVDPGEPIRLAPGIALVPRPITASEQANAAVAAVRLDREPLGSGDAVELTARVVNTSTLPIESTDVVMEVDGRDRDRLIVALARGESRDATFRLVLAADELLRVRIRIDDDALEADNRFHLLVSGPTAIPVLLLQDRRAPPGKALHLEQALRQGDAPGFRVTSRFVSQLRASDIEAADVVIINDATIPGGDLGAQLKSFVEAGGGLLVVAGGRIQGTWPSDEQGLVPGRLGPAQTRTSASPARLIAMNTLHPALAAFAGNEAGDLSSAQVFRYRQLTGVDQQAVLARYDDERVAIAERAIGRGRVLVLTTTLDTSWNTLALQPGFLPLTHEALKYLASHVPAARAISIGDTVDLETYARGLPGYTQTATALSRGTVTTLRTPSGKRMHMKEGEAFVPVREAGFHEVHVSGGGARSLVFAANPLARESDLTPLDVDAFMAGIAVEESSGEANASAALKGDGAIIDDRAWWFLLAVCALLLCVDTWLSNRLSRQVTTA